MSISWNLLKKKPINSGYIFQWVKKLSLKYIRQFNYSLVLFWQCRAGFGRMDGYPVIDVVMQCEGISFVFKIPVDGIKFIFLIQKFDTEIFVDDARYLVKEIQSTVICKDSFRAS